MREIGGGGDESNLDKNRYLNEERGPVNVVFDRAGGPSRWYLVATLVFAHPAVGEVDHLGED